MPLADLPELDITAPEFVADPAGSIEWERYPDGMARSARGVHLLRYDLVGEAYRSPLLRNATKAKMAAVGFSDGPVFEALTGMTTSTEGPEHKRMRRAFAPWFIADNVEKFRAEVRAMIDQWMEQNSSGPVNFADEIGLALPSMVFTQLVGADPGESAFIAHSSAEILRAFLYDPSMRDRVARAALDALDWLNGLIERKSVTPGHDVTSALLDAERDGAITRQHTLRILVTLIIASVDSTRAQMSCNIESIAANKDQWQALKEHPEAIGNAVSELYRYSPQTMSSSRAPEQDFEFHGVELKAAEPVFLSVFAANNDPAAFDRPRKLDVLKVREKPPFSFGNGRHSCVGRIVAAIEQEEMLRSMLAHWADFEITEAEWFGVPLHHGPNTLKLAVTGR
jgi:cytochrome P450